jgi:hypothetical protein
MRVHDCKPLSNVSDVDGDVEIEQKNTWVLLIPAQQKAYFSFVLFTDVFDCLSRAHLKVSLFTESYQRH